MTDFSLQITKEIIRRNMKTMIDAGMIGAPPTDVIIIIQEDPEEEE